MYRANRTGCDRKRDEGHRGESRGFAALAVLAAFGLLAALGLVAGASLINENVAHHASGGSRTVAAAATSVPSSPVTSSTIATSTSSGAGEGSAAADAAGVSSDAAGSDGSDGGLAWVPNTGGSVSSGLADAAGGQVPDFGGSVGADGGSAGAGSGSVGAGGSGLASGLMVSGSGSLAVSGSGGVSSADLAALVARVGVLEGEVSALASTVPSQVATTFTGAAAVTPATFQSVALSQKIDQLKNVTITTPSIEQPSITGGTLAAVTLSSPTVSGGTFSNITLLGTTTVSTSTTASLTVSGSGSLGSLSVSGASVLGALSASGTTTLATSTLAALTVSGSTTLADLALSSPLGLASGGTGATTTAAARSALGLAYATSDDITAGTHIAAWGDSLTYGYGGGGTTFPAELSSLSGYTVYNGGVSGNTSSQILTRFNADTTKHAWPTIIWAGYNNYNDPAQVKADIAAMVAALGHSNYLVLSVLNGSSEPSGSSGYNTIIQLNNDLAATYGSHYLDVRSYLVSLYDPGNAQDVIDHGNDVPPSSLRYDTVHLTGAGYTDVAQKIEQNISTLTSSSISTALTPASIISLFGSPPVLGVSSRAAGYFSNIGVGTTSSNSSLVVVGNNDNAYPGDTATFSSGLGSNNKAGNQLNITNDAASWGLLMGFDGPGVATSAYHGSNASYLVNVVGGPLILGTSNAERLRINSVGNVEIGTTSPYAKLSVTNTSSGPSFVVEDQASPDPTPFVVDASGNVGVGTSAPDGMLDVSGSINGQTAAFVTNKNPGSSAWAEFSVRNGSDKQKDGIRAIALGANWSTAGGFVQDGAVLSAEEMFPGGLSFIAENSAGVMRFYTGGIWAANERMRITSTGSIGIGTTSPWRTLSVSGTAAFSGLTTSTGGESAVCLLRLRGAPGEQWGPDLYRLLRAVQA